MKKIVFLFPTNRQKLIEEVKSGISSDNNLYGFNHLQQFYQVEQVEIYSKLERVLNFLLLPLSWIFNSRYTKLNLGRVVLALPQFWKADAVITCVDSVNKVAAILKKLKLFSAPLICMAGNVMDRTEKFPRLHQWLWSGADRIITHAPVDQEKLIKLGLGDRGTMIPVGSDYKFWHGAGNDGQTLVVSVGADRDRDYQTLLLAAAQLPKLKFVVCCGQKNVEGLNIPDNVEVRINVSALETREVLSKAEMVVLPLRETHRASGQLSMLDAMLMEKPVIVSQTRGTVESYGLIDKKHVLLSQLEDAGDLIKNIKILQNSPKLRQNLREAGRKLALGYTTEKYAEKLKKIVLTSS